MLDTSTLYLILAMAGFIFVAVIMVHHHSCAEDIRRKTSEVEDFTVQINKKIDVVEQDIVDLKLRIDELDEEIDELQGEMQQ